MRTGGACAVRLPRLLLVALAAVTTCSDEPEKLRIGLAPPQSTQLVQTASPSARPDAPSLSGAELMAKFECARCHEGLEGPPPPKEKQCVGCHQEILAGRFSAPASQLNAWKQHIVHFRLTPTLANMGQRLDPAFVERYLKQPFVVRPRLGGTMPRLSISDAEARTIAAALSREAPAPTETPTGSAARGAQLYEEKKCGSCHVFSGVHDSKPFQVTRDAERLAPDLRFARDRMRRDQMVAWIDDPEKIRPGSLMTRLVASRAEAIDLATFVAEAPIRLPPRSVRPRPPALDRPVTYDEVAARVFKKACWHCHSQPDYARGDGGPGNTGGFGFAGKRVDLSSYESMLAGYVAGDGQRKSLFSAAEGEPILLRVLYARYQETEGKVGDVLGMPLGIEPVSEEDYAAVARWINDGHPR